MLNEILGNIPDTNTERNQLETNINKQTGTWKLQRLTHLFYKLYIQTRYQISQLLMICVNSSFKHCYQNCLDLKAIFIFFYSVW